MSDTIIIGLQSDVDALRETVTDPIDGLTTAINTLESENGATVTDRTGGTVDLNIETGVQKSLVSDLLHAPADIPEGANHYILQVEAIKSTGVHSVRQTLTMVRPDNTDITQRSWSRRVQLDNTMVTARDDWRADITQELKDLAMAPYQKKLWEASGDMEGAGTSSSGYNSMWMIQGYPVGSNGATFNVRIDAFMSGVTPGIRITADGSEAVNFFMPYLLSNDVNNSDVNTEVTSEAYGATVRNSSSRETLLGPHASRRMISFRIFIGMGGGNDIQNMVLEGESCRSREDNMIHWTCRLVQTTEDAELIDE